MADGFIPAAAPITPGFIPADQPVTLQAPEPTGRPATSIGPTATGISTAVPTLGSNKGPLGQYLEQAENLTPEGAKQHPVEQFIGQTSKRGKEFANILGTMGMLFTGPEGMPPTSLGPKPSGPIPELPVKAGGNRIPTLPTENVGPVAGPPDYTSAKPSISSEPAPTVTPTLSEQATDYIAKTKLRANEPVRSPNTEPTRPPEATPEHKWDPKGPKGPGWYRGGSAGAKWTAEPGEPSSGEGAKVPIGTIGEGTKPITEPMKFTPTKSPTSARFTTAPIGSEAPPVARPAEKLMPDNRSVLGSVNVNQIEAAQKAKYGTLDKSLSTSPLGSVGPRTAPAPDEFVPPMHKAFETAVSREIDHFHRTGDSAAAEKLSAIIGKQSPESILKSSALPMRDPKMQAAVQRIQKATLEGAGGVNTGIGKVEAKLGGKK